MYADESIIKRPQKTPKARKDAKTSRAKPVSPSELGFQVVTDQQRQEKLEDAKRQVEHEKFMADLEVRMQQSRLEDARRQQRVNDYVAYLDRHLPVPQRPQNLTNQSQEQFDTAWKKTDATLGLSPYFADYFKCGHCMQVLKGSGQERKLIESAKQNPACISAPLLVSGCHFCWRWLSQPENKELQGYRRDKHSDLTQEEQEKLLRISPRARVTALIADYQIMVHCSDQPHCAEIHNVRNNLYRFMFYGRSFMSFSEFSAIKDGTKTFAEVQKSKNFPLYEL